MAASQADPKHVAQPGLNKQDEAAFDALLEPGTDAGELQGIESPGAPVEGSHSVPHQADHSPHGHEVGPTWNEFVSGWDLYQDPIACGVIAGFVLGVLGVFIVLRRAVFVTAAVSQSAGLGVALAFFVQIYVGFGIPPVVWALFLSLSAAVLLSFRTPRSRLPRETIVGLAYLGTSAAAVLVGDRITQEAHDIAGILFGTAVLVRPEDFIAIIIASLVVVMALLAFYRGLLFSGFDAESARVQGLPVRFLELLLWVLVALEVSVATRALGALPVFAFAVLPAMTALALAERMLSALAVAATLGALAGGLGYLFAFFYEFPVGASQAVLATIFFLGSLPVVRLKKRLAFA